MSQNNQNKQQYILDIAEAIFLRHGFKNTIIRKITVAAKINTAMLHYYFRSKEQLFEAVLKPIDIEIVLVSIFGTLIHCLTKLEKHDDEVSKVRIQKYFEPYFESFRN